MTSTKADNASAELAEDLLQEPGIIRSTMTGYPRLRSQDAFFACFERTTGHLIVKRPPIGSTI